MAAALEGIQYGVCRPYFRFDCGAAALREELVVRLVLYMSHVLMRPIPRVVHIRPGLFERGADNSDL